MSLQLDRLPAMEMRIYGPGTQGAQDDNRPLVLHFHGGNFIDGSLDDGYVVARLLAEAGATVVSLDYPRAPGTCFPAAIEAGHAVLEWLGKRENRSTLGGRSSRLFVAGEEAGGNLAAAVAMMGRDRQTLKLSGQILISPMLNPWLATASMREVNGGAAGCRWNEGWHQYLLRPSDANHPYVSPATALRLANLPAALLLTAIDDPMRDDVVHYALRLRDAGVAVQGKVLPTSSGWPCTLMQHAGIAASWAEEVRGQLRHFFASAGNASAETSP